MRAARPIAPGRGPKMLSVLPFSRWPLRVKLAAFVLIASLVPVAVLAPAEVHETRLRMFNAAAELLAARAEQLVAEVDAFHLGHQRAAARVAGWPKIGELL